MMKKILGALAGVIAAFLVYVALQPSEYIVSRELAIKAPPEVLFPFLNNVKMNSEWMPWKEQDPQLEMKYSGPTDGVGATASWDSQGQMGAGQSVVTEATMNQSVKVKLNYTRPMMMEQMAEMSLTPQADGTTVVRWSASGTNGFLGKLFGTFMNMDKLVGGMFEKGLSNLKAKVEK